MDNEKLERKEDDLFDQFMEEVSRIAELEKQTSDNEWFALNYGGYINIQGIDNYCNDNLLDEDKTLKAKQNSEFIIACKKFFNKFNEVDAELKVKQTKDGEILLKKDNMIEVYDGGRYLNINGIKYSSYLFSELGMGGLKEGLTFKIMKRDDDGALTIKAIQENNNEKNSSNNVINNYGRISLNERSSK